MPDARDIKSVSRLSVLTLNCWGLLLIAKHRLKRVQALAEYLASPAAASLDVVCLQEIWVSADAQLLITAARTSGLTHSIHFQSGTFGAGLVTISRFPILHASFHQYSAAGDPLAITCGDYYAAKGFGWARLATPAGPVDVFNTHLHANYSHKVKAHPVSLAGTVETSSEASVSTASAHHAIQVPMDSFAPFRMSQMWQLAQSVSNAFKMGGLGIVLAGDLNSKPDSLEMALLRSQLPFLKDAWQQVQLPQVPSSARKANGAAKAASGPDPGYTCAHPDCAYSSTRQIPERIDYVLSSLNAVRCSVVLQRIPGGTSYSDHFAVQAELALPSNTASMMSAEAPFASDAGFAGVKSSDLLLQAAEILEQGEKHCQQAQGRAYQAALLCMAICVVCIATLVTPDIQGILPSRQQADCASSSWFAGKACDRVPGDGGGPAAAVAATALMWAGVAAASLLALGCSALGAILGLKGLLADPSQQHALHMSAVSIRTALSAQRPPRSDADAPETSTGTGTGTGSASGSRLGSSSGAAAGGMSTRDTKHGQLLAQLQASARITSAAAEAVRERKAGPASSPKATASAGSSADVRGESPGTPSSPAAKVNSAMSRAVGAAAKAGTVAKKTAAAAGDAASKVGSAVAAALEHAAKPL